MSKKTAIVIGAGIIGLATARALAIRGYRVTVIERNFRAVGASIRNFGMIWPIGQPDGELYQRAALSRKIWLETCAAAGIWHDNSGSLHLAYSPDEFEVLKELQEIYKYRGYKILNAGQVLQKSPAVSGNNLLGGLYSTEEIIVNPRTAIPAISEWLYDKFGVEFIRGIAATRIENSRVWAGDRYYESDQIYVCSGADFETLYPEIFALQPLTKCKLQMLKIKKQPDDWRIGPALCGGLSLLHYASFKNASSLEVLRSRIQESYPEYIKFGIHVMVSQNDSGELIIGDSHEYGTTHDPFNNSDINRMILNYLKGFAIFKDNEVVETWNGVYPKLTNGNTNIVLAPAEGVTIINGLGGAGMTLGFGLCEQVVGR